MLFQLGFFVSNEALRSIRMGINVQNLICPVCLFVPDQLERSFAHKEHSDNQHILCAARHVQDARQGRRTGSRVALTSDLADGDGSCRVRRSKIAKWEW